MKSLRLRLIPRTHEPTKGVLHFARIGRVQLFWPNKSKEWMIHALGTRANTTILNNQFSLFAVCASSCLRQSNVMRFCASFDQWWFGNQIKLIETKRHRNCRLVNESLNFRNGKAKQKFTQRSRGEGEVVDRRKTLINEEIRDELTLDKSIHMSLHSKCARWMKSGRVTPVFAALINHKSSWDRTPHIWTHGIDM